MTLELAEVVFDAEDPVRLAQFWAGVLGGEPVSHDWGGVVLRPADDPGFALGFMPGGRPKTEQNQLHFDLTSATWEDQQRTVEQALSLGARHVDVGQRPEETHVVLGDPEGNEFCVIAPGNAFLADCGFLGAVACDGSQRVGYFWRDALGWPLVWDQDEETAIRAPYGGPKVTWGGPPLKPKTAKYRLHLDLAPSPDSDQQTEVARLLSLGASRADIGQGDVDWVVMADPDGHEFCVWSEPAG